MSSKVRILVTPALPGAPGPAGTPVELQNSGTAIQWRYTGQAWSDLVLLSALTGATGQVGPAGPTGAQGPTGSQGPAGREVQIQNSGTAIQWRYVGDVSWMNIVTLAAITGPQGAIGATGAQGPAGQGVPVGGSTGQILAKIDGTNYNTQWVTPSIGSGADGQVAFWTGASTQSGSVGLLYVPSTVTLSLVNSTFSSAGRGLAITQTTADGASAYMTFRKSRGGLVTSGIGLGTLDFQGFDGTAYQISSRISASAAGTPSTGIVPGNISFFTANTAGTLTSRMSIDEAGNVGIGIGTTTQASSAVLEVKSTTKGFLPPRMTAVQASAIASPAEGLMVYVTDTNLTFLTKGWWGYDGAAWKQLG